MKTTISKKIPWQKLFRHLIPNAGTLVLMALMLFAYNAWAAPHQATSAQETSSTFSYQGTLADTNGTRLPEMSISLSACTPLPPMALPCGKKSYGHQRRPG